MKVRTATLDAGEFWARRVVECPAFWALLSNGCWPANDLALAAIKPSHLTTAKRDVHNPFGIDANASAVIRSVAAVRQFRRLVVFALTGFRRITSALEP